MTYRIQFSAFPWQKHQFHLCSIKILLPPFFPPITEAINFSAILAINIVLLQNLLAHNHTRFVIQNSLHHIAAIKDKRHLNTLYFFEIKLLCMNIMQSPIRNTLLIPGTTIKIIWLISITQIGLFCQLDRHIISCPNILGVN